MFFASGFSWMALLPTEAIAGFTGLQAGTVPVVAHAWLACFILLAFAAVGRMGLQRAMGRNGLEKYFADDRLSARNIAEVIIGGWQGMMADLLEKADVRYFMPFIAAMFMYIFVCNIFGIFPGFLPPTDNINASVGMAVLVFLLFVGVGMKRDTVGFLKHIAGPVWWLMPLMIIVESVSLIVRPIALTIRLTGNMFGDHMVYSIFSGMVPILVPVPFIMLAMLVSAIQAFVFSLLTVIYIALSVPHHEHDDH